MKKPKLISVCLFFATFLIFVDCSEETAAPKSSKSTIVSAAILKDSDVTLFNKIASLYSISESASQGGKKLFEKDDIQIEQSELYVTATGERVVRIPVTKRFGKNSGLAGMAHLMIRESKGLENALFLSMNYPVNANKNLTNPKEFTGTLKFYKIQNRKVLGAGGYVFNKGNVTSVLRYGMTGNSVNAARTEGWWDDFTEGVSEEWDDISDLWDDIWTSDCWNDASVIGNGLVYAGAGIACAASIVAAVDTGGIATPIAVGTCLGFVGAGVLFTDSLLDSGCLE